MTRREAKRRLRFIAEWWEPKVLRAANPACVIQVAMEIPELGNTMNELRQLGFTYDQRWAIADAWDRCDRDAAIQAIEAL